MRYTETRIFAGVLLLAVLIVAAGCGKPKRYGKLRKSGPITNINPDTALHADQLHGRWRFPGGETIPGVFNISNDGSFVFTGWSTANFVSKGRWTFDASNAAITIRFLDNKEYWAIQMDLQTNRFKSSRGIVRLDPQRSEITMLVRNTWRGDQLFFNFLGWNFFHTNS